MCSTPQAIFINCLPVFSPKRAKHRKVSVERDSRIDTCTSTLEEYFLSSGESKRKKNVCARREKEKSAEKTHSPFAV